MEKIRLGIIGASSFAEAHLIGIAQCKNTEVVAVCDIVEERAKKMADTFLIPSYYTDYHEMLARDDIDAVTIPLPDQLHCQATVDALRAGKHVMCEKPMALNMDDCRKMIEASKESGKQLMIGQVCRYTDAFVKAKKMVEEGEIGELFFVESEYAHDYSKIGGIGNWRVTPERHPIIGGGCHAVDLLRWIAGNPTEVTAYANNKVLTDWPINDCTVAIMKFPNNVIGKVMTSVGCKRKYTMRTVLYGTKGTIVVDNTSPTFTIYKEEFRGEDTYCGAEQQRVEIRIPVGVNNHNTQAEIGDFCQCLLDGRPVPTPGEEGATTVAACLAIVEAAKTDKKIKISYDF